MLFDIPSWVLRMSVGELAGAIGYTLLFALIESILLALPFVLGGFLLPKAWQSTYLLPLSTLVLLTSAGAAFAMHYSDKLQNYEKLLALSWLGTNLVLGFVVIRFARLAAWLERLMDRLAVLVYLYLAADVLGTIVVVVRNL
jgi:hypothetical protein